MTLKRVKIFPRKNLLYWKFYQWYQTCGDVSWLYFLFLLHSASDNIELVWTLIQNLHIPDSTAGLPAKTWPLLTLSSKQRPVWMKDDGDVQLSQQQGWELQVTGSQENQHGAGVMVTARSRLEWPREKDSWTNVFPILLSYCASLKLAQTYYPVKTNFHTPN